MYEYFFESMLRYAQTVTVGQLRFPTTTPHTDMAQRGGEGRTYCKRIE